MVVIIQESQSGKMALVNNVVEYMNQRNLDKCEDAKTIRLSLYENYFQFKHQFPYVFEQKDKKVKIFKYFKKLKKEMILIFHSIEHFTERDYEMIIRYFKQICDSSIKIKIILVMDKASSNRKSLLNQQFLYHLKIFDKQIKPFNKSEAAQLILENDLISY